MHPTLPNRTVAVAVFSSREDPATLRATLGAILEAGKAQPSLIVDVVINGNPALAGSLAAAPLRVTSNARIRIWLLERPDKAAAWNEYIGRIFPDADYAIFVDGYAAIDADAVEHMLAAHGRQPDALAVSGVQRHGPSARHLQQQQLQRGGLCGNLYLLPRATIDRLKALGFRLPQGIYRNDSTLGAAIYLDFDPAAQTWRKDRIVTVPEASFTYRTPRVWRVADWKSLARRKARQSQGVLENLAVREHFIVRRRAVRELPSDVRDLVLHWQAANKRAARGLFVRRPLTWLAFRRLAARRPLDTQSDVPRLLADASASSTMPAMSAATPVAQHGTGRPLDSAAPATR